MYVTRPLSMYRKSPGSLGMSPPEGPNSGYLVLFDEESEEEVTSCCWGTYKDSSIRELPFPQNKFLNVTHTSTTPHDGQIQTHTTSYKVLFIPVMGQPLSSNRYYVILAEGKHIGKACTCSTEKDIGTCCFCLNYIKEVQPLPLNHMSIYQQVVIIPQRRRGSFVAKSIAHDGFPPNFLSGTGWTVSTLTPRDCELGEAYGVDVSLQMCLPNFNFPISNNRSSSTVLGKWYCPFMFIGEERSLIDQMKKSLFYEMSMEQLWEKIDACENDGSSQGNLVVVSVNVQKEVARLYGKEMVQEETRVIDGMRWFRPLKHEGGGLGVGLSLAIVERMRWEEVRGGWVEGKEMNVKVERMEKFGGGNGGWKKFGCYVLVERFVLRRMNGSVVLTYDFRHTHQIQCKWE
ncbi:uncharacterized protein LOC143878127 [Tasmannia lanceolata]|uniref:uncharacterized protein LOC143878127 n=1 Tax=Tasmannia lanceolata TaxID=3420 RepID=UPI004064A6AB